jgi:hypothetical protein
MPKWTGAVIIIAVLTAGFLGFEPSPVSAQRACKKPQPEVWYTPTSMQVTLRLNLAGCRWWRGSIIELDGVLQQAVGESYAVSRTCGLATWAGEGPSPHGQQRIKTCNLRLRLEHLPVDAEVYDGSFSYTWRKGRATVGFDYLCTSTPALTECREH